MNEEERKQKDRKWTKRQQSWTNLYSLFPTPSLNTFGGQVSPLVYYPFSFRMMRIALMMVFMDDDSFDGRLSSAFPGPRSLLWVKQAHNRSHYPLEWWGRSIPPTDSPGCQAWIKHLWSVCDSLKLRLRSNSAERGWTSQMKLGELRCRIRQWWMVMMMVMVIKGR